MLIVIFVLLIGAVCAVAVARRVHERFPEDNRVARLSATVAGLKVFSVTVAVALVAQVLKIGDDQATVAAAAVSASEPLTTRSVPPNSPASSELIVRGTTLRVGQSADDVFSVLRPAELVEQSIAKVPDGLRVTKLYEADGKRFTLELKRSGQDGPYVITNIITKRPPSVQQSAVPAAFSVPLEKFEASELYAKLHANRNSYRLRDGSINYNYRTDDPENPYSSRSIELSGVAEHISRIGISWHGESVRSPAKLTAPKEELLVALIDVMFPGLDSDAVLEYVRAHHSTTYEDGSDAMPRHRIGGVPVFAGTVGSSLIIGFDGTAEP